MITEALKYIRAMKHQLDVYTNAEKVLEELSVLAETGAAIRAENRDASERLQKINDQADARLSAAQLEVTKMTDEAKAKITLAEKTSKDLIDNRQSELNDSAEAYQHYQDAVKNHKLYMENAHKEKAQMESALENLKKRFKL